MVFSGIFKEKRGRGRQRETFLTRRIKNNKCNISGTNELKSRSRGRAMIVYALEELDTQKKNKKIHFISVSFNHIYCSVKGHQLIYFQGLHISSIMYPCKLYQIECSVLIILQSAKLSIREGSPCHISLSQVAFYKCLIYIKQLRLW